MEKIDKMNELKKLGYLYDPISGNVFSPRGKELNTINDRYKCIRLQRKIGSNINIYHHQFAYWWVYTKIVDCIDHINRNKLDNRIENLRESSPIKNSHNIEPGIGYSYHPKQNTYQARIRVNGKLIALGYHKTKEEASKAYLDAKKIYHSDV